MLRFLKFEKLYARSHREDLELESGSITLKGGLCSLLHAPEGTTKVPS